MEEGTKRLLLKDGYIVDGTGEKGFEGSLIINGDKIEDIIEGSFAGQIGGFYQVIDCRGLVISPGFIDMHSHLDWYLPNRNYNRAKIPFIKQGITTLIAGNCGFSAAGIKKDTRYLEQIEDNLFKGANEGISWYNFEDYFKVVEETGLSHNVIMLAGHGTSRTSVCGDASKIAAEENREIIGLLEEAMDQGAAGVSFGLQYEPGHFSNVDELVEVAHAVKKKNKLVTAHARAYSSLSGDYPLVPFGKPHNIKALEDLIEVARRTKVKLQYSHPIFVGKASQKTCQETLNLIDKAITEGIDISFDTYGHHCGASVITVFLPAWFKAAGLEACNNKFLLTKLRAMMTVVFHLLGFDYSNIQIMNANCEELNCYNGMYLSDIAAKRGMSNFDNYIDFIKKSKAGASVLMHNYTSEQNLYDLIRHKASMFMTDSWMEPQEWQNPGLFGSLPRIIQLVREKNLLTIEETIHKLSGAAAAKTGIKDRGCLRKGLAADITVLDWNNTRFDIKEACTSGEPEGIKHVFINGGHIVEDGKLSDYCSFGRVVKL